MQIEDKQIHDLAATQLEYDGHFELATELRAYVEGLKGEVETYRKALEWYADEETYMFKINEESDPPGQAYTDVIEDRGDIARKALEGSYD